MPLDLTGIHNIGEFYSHHYPDALLENDLKGLFGRWREQETPAPDERLDRCSADFFTAKTEALKRG